MVLDEFDALFEECVDFPLRRTGFHRYKKTKTLVMTCGDAQVALIRLGGRFTSPGCATRTICFRHVFLRPIESESPVEFSLYPLDYPFKLVPRDFVWFPIMRPKYRPLNLGLREYSRYCFDGRSSDQVRQDLTKLRHILVNRVLPWARQMSPEVVAEQIRKFGEDAWCEKRWLEDYEAHASMPGH